MSSNLRERVSWATSGRRDLFIYTRERESARERLSQVKVSEPRLHRVIPLSGKTPIRETQRYSLERGAKTKRPPTRERSSATPALDRHGERDRDLEVVRAPAPDRQLFVSFSHISVVSSTRFGRWRVPTKSPTRSARGFFPRPLSVVFHPDTSLTPTLKTQREGSSTCGRCGALGEGEDHRAVGSERQKVSPVDEPHQPAVSTTRSTVRFGNLWWRSRV